MSPDVIALFVMLGFLILILSFIAGLVGGDKYWQYRRDKMQHELEMAKLHFKVSEAPPLHIERQYDRDVIR